MTIFYYYAPKDSTGRYLVNMDDGSQKKFKVKARMDIILDERNLDDNAHWEVKEVRNKLKMTTW